MGEIRDAHILIGKPEGKKQLGRPARRWEINIIISKRKRIRSFELDASGSG
jgi:hypothetical protein